MTPWIKAKLVAAEQLLQLSRRDESKRKQVQKEGRE